MRNRNREERIIELFRIEFQRKDIIMKKDDKVNNKFLNEKITRKNALKKVGITALTATSLLFLETKKASALSDPGSGGTGWT